MGNRPRARQAPPPAPVRTATASTTRRRRARGVALLVLAAVVFALLRGVHALAPEPTDTDVYTEHVVLVGVAGRFQLTDTDRTVLGAHLDDAQAGVVSTRARYVGRLRGRGLDHARGRAAGPRSASCATRRSRSRGRVRGSPTGTPGSRPRRPVGGTPGSGTLAGSVSGLRRRRRTGCRPRRGPPGRDRRRVREPRGLRRRGRAADLPGDARRRRRGLRPGHHRPRRAGRRDAARERDRTGGRLGRPEPRRASTGSATTLPGFVTSASTRREGIVTLTDLTRELVDVGRGSSRGRHDDRRLAAGRLPRPT